MATVTDDLIRLYTSSDALALGTLVRGKQVSAAELVEAAITVIDRVNPRLNAVVHKLYDMARAQAVRVPQTAPFAGVPFLLKELASMWEGAPLTNSCAWLKDVHAPADSEATRRTKAAGFVLVGKSNAPENGWSISTEPKLYGVTHNLWRADVTAGGSSGGVASAVAARMVPLAEASDGAGSIRVPASNCGVVGLKRRDGGSAPRRSLYAADPVGALARAISPGTETPTHRLHGDTTRWRADRSRSGHSRAPHRGGAGTSRP
jgi:amidase